MSTTPAIPLLGAGSVWLWSAIVKPICSPAARLMLSGYSGGTLWCVPEVFQRQKLYHEKMRHLVMFFVLLPLPSSPFLLKAVSVTGRIFLIFSVQKNKFIPTFLMIVPSSGKNQPWENYRQPSIIVTTFNTHFPLCSGFLLNDVFNSRFFMNSYNWLKTKRNKCLSIML